jgi:5-methylcytosine-specific restriction endonuclease McrA
MLAHVRQTTTARGYGHPWQQLRLLILARDQWICRWCGAPADTVDHLEPKALGGSDSPANRVAACGPCNYRRGGELRGQLQLD